MESRETFVNAAIRCDGVPKTRRIRRSQVATRPRYPIAMRAASVAPMTKSNDWQWQIPLGVVGFLILKSQAEHRLDNPLAELFADDPGPGLIPRSLRDDYALRWRTMIVRPDRMAAADAIARRMAAREARYRAVTDPMGVPWYWLAAIHELEHSGRFTTSMTVVDPIDVPLGETIPDATISDAQWDDTARSLLRSRGLTDWHDWSVAGSAYQWERFSGFGYRSHDIPTPYLWSFSNQYTTGKFIRAGVFSPTTTSQQAGALVLLRRLIDLGAVTL